MHSYPSIFNLGHPAVKSLFDVEVNVEEKIDGCVGVNTPILTTNLQYIRAGDLNSDGQEEIAHALMRHFWPQILRASTGGFPEYYKQLLLDRQFEEDTV